MPRDQKSVAVVGSGGRLGAALVRILSADPNYSVSEFHRLNLDLSQTAQLRSQLEDTPFDILINAAAYTAVDDCEKFPEQARLVNTDAVRTMAQVCAHRGARMIQFSTDFVFDGNSDSPYSEDDPPNPLSVYGRTKYEGELALLDCSSDNLAVRVSWIFGPDRPGFPCWLIQNALAKEDFAIVNDKIGSPTLTSDCANYLKPLLSGDLAIGGIIHLSNSGAPTWIEWGQFCLDCVAQAGIPLKTTRLGGFPMGSLESFVAPRPLYSALSTEKYRRLTGTAPRPWKDAVSEHISKSIIPNISSL